MHSNVSVVIYQISSYSISPSLNSPCTEICIIWGESWKASTKKSWVWERSCIVFGSLAKVSKIGAWPQYKCFPASNENDVSHQNLEPPSLPGSSYLNFCLFLGYVKPPSTRVFLHHLASCAVSASVSPFERFEVSTTSWEKTLSFRCKVVGDCFDRYQKDVDIYTSRVNKIYPFGMNPNISITFVRTPMQYFGFVRYQKSWVLNPKEVLYVSVEWLVDLLLSAVSVLRQAHSEKGSVSIHFYPCS